MGGSNVKTGGGVEARVPPRFVEANVKSLIFTIGAPRFITFAYCAPQILMPNPAYDPTPYYSYGVVCRASR